MKFPHTVRLDGPDGSLTITRRLSDLQFRSDIEGGFASGSFSLKRAITKKQLDMFTDVLIFDGRNGLQVGGGRLLTPGRSNSEQGQVAKIKFTGEGLASMQDVEAPHALIDGSLESWELYSRTTSKVDAGTNTYPGYNESVLMMSTNEGQSYPAGTDILMTNRLALICNQTLGGIYLNHKSGISNSDWKIRVRAQNAAQSGGELAYETSWSDTLSARIVKTVNGDFTSPLRPRATIEWVRTDTTHVATEDSWSAIRDPGIRMQIYGQDRELRTTGYTNEYVLAHEAFIDWVARYCPRLDIEGAEIAAGTYEFDQLAWPDGITGLGLMRELFELEQGLMWAVYEKQDNGRHRVVLAELPTDVRYELSVNDGFDDPSPADELYNVAYVTWTSKAGKPMMTRVPATGVSPVPQLDAADVVRSKTLPLGTEIGSAAQATKRGETFLAEHAIVPNGGQVTIGGARRILDNYTGRMVAPWEILPGYLGRIRGVNPRSDSLNPAGGPDGSTISRIMAMDWQDSRGAAVLDLDTYTLTVRQKLVDVVNQIKRRPR